MTQRLAAEVWRFERALDEALSTVAPAWPLDSNIAVNPAWGLVHRPVVEAAARLRALAGLRLLPPRHFFATAWKEGTLRVEHLDWARAQTDDAPWLETLTRMLAAEEPRLATRAKLTDLVAWGDFVVDQVSRHCARWFDDAQASLPLDRSGGLYASWRRRLVEDATPGLVLRDAQVSERAASLPSSARALVEQALVALDVAPEQHASYLAALLLDVNGWASVCAQRRFTARLDADATLSLELLAIRLAWEWLAHREGGASLQARWQRAMAQWPEVDRQALEATRVDALFLSALERAWQQSTWNSLANATAHAPAAPEVQLAFCIDVRSEPFRRALEAAGGDAVETLGFAGFFGLPMAYLPFGAPRAEPRLPGLLSPKFQAGDAGLTEHDAVARHDTLRAEEASREAARAPAGAFGFVEATGMFSLGALLRELLGRGEATRAEEAGLSPEARQRRQPRLLELDLTRRVDLAAGILRGLGLVGRFAPQVVLVGHRSQTRNNPLAAALDCGACCGHGGEVNARVAAALLNDVQVRHGLRARGVEVPAHVTFVAAEHDTTTDEVSFFDDVRGPVREWLVQAGDVTRRTRLAALSAASGTPSAEVHRRARDWAELRPEWGLVNNAAFVIAPRARTRELDLQGRAFLHDYDAGRDDGFATLELLLTAPMLVTHWINFQYLASTSDPRRFGSGNKLLHNVVGEHLGVLEGGGGDLRIGLSLQSVHDGQRFRHEPLRLSVFVEAPRHAIDQVLAVHDVVRHLVHHGWLHLFQLEGATVSRRTERGWVSESP